MSLSHLGRAGMTFAAAILEVQHVFFLVGPAETSLLSLVAEPWRNSAPFLVAWLVNVMSFHLRIAQGAKITGETGETSTRMM